MPLLQSTISQMPGSILGEGEGTGIDISQNMPVQPGKHSQVMVSFSSSTHSPLVQLIKSHKEISGVGEGDKKGVEVKKGVEKGRLELGSWATDEEKGIIRLSELSTIKINDDTTVSPTLIVDETSLMGVREGIGIGENDGI